MSQSSKRNRLKIISLRKTSKPLISQQKTLKNVISPQKTLKKTSSLSFPGKPLKTKKILTPPCNRNQNNFSARHFALIAVPAVTLMFRMNVMAPMMLVVLVRPLVAMFVKTVASRRTGLQFSGGNNRTTHLTPENIENPNNVSKQPKQSRNCRFYIFLFGKYEENQWYT